jgi:phytoene synthase
MIKGVRRDLRPLRFKTFSELHRYCLQVAGGPGLASMEIFGFKDESHRNYAENLGMFLQLVNMARDYQEDLSLHRQYFPAEDFKKFHLIPGSIDETNAQWRSFVEFQLDRAWLFWKRAQRALTRRQRSELATAEAIAAVYVKLFQKLKKDPQKILRGKTSLSRWDKILSVAGAACRCFYWRGAGG